MTTKTTRAIAPSQIPQALLKGLAVSVLIMLGGTALMSALIIREVVRETAIGYCAMGILLISAMAGAFAAIRKAEKQKYAVSLLQGALYFIVLMAANALLYKGGYEGIGASLILIMGGSIAAAFLRKTSAGYRRPSKRKKKHR